MDMGGGIRRWTTETYRFFPTDGVSDRKRSNARACRLTRPTKLTEWTKDGGIPADKRRRSGGGAVEERRTKNRCMMRISTP